MAHITGLSPVAARVPPAEVPRADREFIRTVAQAVGRLNELQAAGEGREITFSIDSVSKRPVVKVVDVETREVVHQWPAEYLLQLDADKGLDSQ